MKKTPNHEDKKAPKVQSELYYEKQTVDLRTTDARDGKRPLYCNAHLHYHIELVYMLEGHSTVYIDYASYDIGPGDILIVFPNQVHRYVSMGGEKYYLMILNPDMLPELCDRIVKFRPSSAVIRGVGEKMPEMDFLARQICSLSESGRGNEDANDFNKLILHGYLLSFFGQIMRMMPPPDEPGEDSHAMQMIVNFCSKNFTKDLSLLTLERELHLNRYYISHLFNNKMQIRFNDYVNSLRISDACRRLRQSKMSITEISEIVGFNTLRTFNRAFYKQMGFTPSAYRSSIK